MTDILSEFTELIEISSPSLGERLMADALTAKLSEMGLSVYEDDAGAIINGDAGNLYAYLPPTDIKYTESVLFAAHMDRVPGGDGIHVIDHGEYYSSDGKTILAADDIAGVCAILNGIRRAQQSGRPHCGVEVIFTVCEENGTKGAKSLDYSRIKSKAGYCMDSAGRFGRVITGAPTIDRLKLDVWGLRAHAGAEPEKGINALKAAAGIIARVPEGRLDCESTANFGVIRAGEATNVVCDHAMVLGEVRSHNPEKVVSYEENLRKLIKEITASVGARADLAVVHQEEAFKVDPSSPDVTKIISAIGKAGGEGYSSVGGGGMDANNFNKRGIVSVGVSTGYIKNHTCEEILYKEDLIKAGKTVEELIYEWS